MKRSQPRLPRDFYHGLLSVMIDKEDLGVSLILD